MTPAWLERVKTHFSTQDNDIPLQIILTGKAGVNLVMERQWPELQFSASATWFEDQSSAVFIGVLRELNVTVSGVKRQILLPAKDGVSLLQIISRQINVWSLTSDQKRSLLQFIDRIVPAWMVDGVA